jgi:ribonuclease P protein component
LSHEKNFSTQQQTPQEGARIPCPHVVHRGAQSPCLSPPQGAQALGGLTLQGQSLPRAARLRKRPQFKQIYEQGLRVAGKSLVLFVTLRVADPAKASAPLPDPHTTAPARLGITVTKRVGPSVLRNRARRVVREAYRRHRASFAGYDMVVNVKTGATLTRREMEQELLSLFRRARNRMPRPHVDT